MRKYTEDEKFMKEAIKQAKKAEAIGDVPIGCVIVHDGKIIARGYNKPDVCRSNCAGESDESRYWQHECESWLWRLNT